jgi:hypothetical protein
MFDSAGGAATEKPMAGHGTVRDTENPTERAANEISSHNPRPPRANHDVRRYPLADATISKPTRLVTVSK